MPAAVYLSNDGSGARVVLTDSTGQVITNLGTGTVTSVGLTMPADFSVASSPVTGTGTVAVTRANQSANLFLAGPASGSAATPAYRAAVAADLPTSAQAVIRSPATMFYLKDDFLTGSGTTGQVGEFSWARAGGTTVVGAGEASHPGILQEQTGTTSATVAALATRATPATGSLLGSEFFDNQWLFRLNTNDANTTVRFGMAVDITTSQPTSGIYLEKLDADTTWFAVCRNAGTQTRTNTTVATTTAWAAVNIRRIDASTIGFRVAATLGGIGAAAETTVTTNIPATGILPSMHIINSTTSSKTVDIDYFDLLITTLTR